MTIGTLEVHLISAHGLKCSDVLSKSDPYVLLSCSTQTQRSQTASNQGPNPVWNQTFKFPVEQDAHELSLRVMDSDFLEDDDDLGLAKIPLRGVISAGKLAATPFNVVQPDGKFHGEIKVELKFIPKGTATHAYGGYGSF